MAYLSREVPFDTFPEDYPMPDLIFLDINMPRMNGWEFIEHFQKMPEHIPKSPLMMLTTSLNTDDEERALEFGVVRDFLRKPLSPEKTHEIIQQYFQGRL